MPDLATTNVCKVYSSLILETELESAEINKMADHWGLAEKTFHNLKKITKLVYCLCNEVSKIIQLRVADEMGKVGLPFPETHIAYVIFMNLSVIIKYNLLKQINTY